MAPMTSYAPVWRTLAFILLVLALSFIWLARTTL